MPSDLYQTKQVFSKMGLYFLETEETIDGEDYIILTVEPEHLDVELLFDQTDAYVKARKWKEDKK